MNMYTEPAWRGKRIASNLLAEILKFLKKKKIEKVHLLATAQGERVYKKSGFLVRTAEKYIERNVQGRFGK